MQCKQSSRKQGTGHEGDLSLSLSLLDDANASNASTVETMQAVAWPTGFAVGRAPWQWRSLRLDPWLRGEVMDLEFFSLLAFFSSFSAFSLLLLPNSPYSFSSFLLPLLRDMFTDVFTLV